MGKVKVKNISNSKMNAICHKHYYENCEGCPLRRPKSEEDRKKGGTSNYLMCYKRCRAFYLADKQYYQQILELDLTEKEREYHEYQWQYRQEEQMKLEQEEIDLTEKDYR